MSAETKQKRGGARLGTGPKTGLDAAPVSVLLTLGRDHADYIRQTGNASAFVRALISDSMSAKNNYGAAKMNAQQLREAGFKPNHIELDAERISNEIENAKLDSLDRRDEAEAARILRDQQSAASKQGTQAVLVRLGRVIGLCKTTAKNGAVVEYGREKTSDGKVLFIATAKVSRAKKLLDEAIAGNLDYVFVL